MHLYMYGGEMYMQIFIHVRRMNAHGKGTWKFACASNCVEHEGIWMPCALPRVVHEGTWERCIAIFMYLSACGELRYIGKVHGNFHLLLSRLYKKVYGNFHAH